MNYKVYKDNNGNIVLECDNNKVAIQLNKISSYHMFAKEGSHLVVVPLSNGLPIVLPHEAKNKKCMAIIGLKEYDEKVSRRKRI